MRKSLRLLFPLVAVAMAAAPVFAQNQYRFEVFGGGNFPMDKDFEISFPQSSVPMQGTHQFSAGGRGGIRLGVDGPGHWGQDLDYSFGTNASKIVNHSNGGQFAFTTRTHQISYNALWYPAGQPRNGKVFPYLIAGIGGTFNTLSQATVNEALDPNRGGLGKLRNENIFAFNAGTGVRVRVNSVYGVRVDIRDFMTRAIRYQLPKSSDDPTATVFPIGGIFHQFMLSFSFVYYF